MVEHAKSAVCWLLELPLEKISRFVLGRTLSRFVKTLDDDQFKAFSLQQGTFSLHDLEIKESLVNGQILAGFPLRLVHGNVGKVEVKDHLLSYTLHDVYFDFDFIPDQPLSASTLTEPKGEDVLSRSLLLGSISKADIRGLREDGLGRQDAKTAASSSSSSSSSAADDVGQNAVQELLDKLLQKVKMGVRNGTISIRFPSYKGGGLSDVLRIELPWLEFANEDLPVANGMASRFYCKVLTFQTFLVHLQTGLNKNDLSGSVGSPRGGKERQEESPSEPDSDLILMGFADNRNSVEIKFPADPSFIPPDEVSYYVNIFLQSVHLVLCPRHILALQSIVNKIMLSTGKAANPSSLSSATAAGARRPHHSHFSSSSASSSSASTESAPMVSVQVEIVQILAALLQEDQTMTKLWDGLLSTVGSEPGPDGQRSSGQSASLRERSPCTQLREPHVLVEVKRQEEAGAGSTIGMLLRHCTKPPTPGSMGYLGSTTEMFLSQAELYYVTHNDSPLNTPLPRILEEEETVLPNGLVSRKILQFLPVLFKDCRESAQVSIVVNKTIHRGAEKGIKADVVVNQNISIRMCPWLKLYSSELPRLGKIFHALAADSPSETDQQSDEFMEAFSVDCKSYRSKSTVRRNVSSCSFHSCEPTGSTFRTPTRRDSPAPSSGGSPMSSTSDFDEVFRDGFRKGVFRDPRDPPPYNAAMMNNRPDTGSNGEGHNQQRVTWGGSTIHSPIDLADSSTPPLALPPEEPAEGPTVVLLRDVKVKGQMIVVSSYFTAKEWDKVPLLGPYLVSILEHSSKGRWLDTALALETEGYEARYRQVVPLSKQAHVSPPETTPQVQVFTDDLKLVLQGEGEDQVLIRLQRPKAKRGCATKERHAPRRKEKEKETAAIVITMHPNPNPTEAGQKTRVSDMLKECEEKELRSTALNVADITVDCNFDTATVNLRKDTLCLMQYMITEVSEALSLTFGSELIPAPPGVPTSGLSALPTSLLRPPPSEGLPSWQRPTCVVAVSLRCADARFDILAPRCFSPDLPPPYTVPYPQQPPCHHYVIQATDLQLFTIAHTASDVFVRVSVDASGFELAEKNQPHPFTRAAPDVELQPLLRTYHSLYHKSFGKSESQKGLRLLVSYCQCSPANPAFAAIRDRQDIQVQLAFCRVILTHKVAHDGDNWLLVITEAFTDVERVYETAAGAKGEDSDSDDSDENLDADQNDPKIMGRLKATNVNVTAEEVIVDYIPLNLAARVLLLARKIQFRCLAVMLSEEFRAEVALGGVTALLDDGNFREDLLAYNDKAGSKSLIGKSLNGLVCDLELLGFIVILETGPNTFRSCTTGGPSPSFAPEASEWDIEVVVTTLAPTKDCTPHLRGRGVRPKRQQPQDGQIECDDETEKHKPFVVEVRSGSHLGTLVKTNFCSDSFKLFKDVLVGYLSGIEQQNIPRVHLYYREALGLPPDTPPAAPVPPPRTNDNAVHVAAQGVSKALNAEMPAPVSTPPSNTSGGWKQEVIVREAHCDPLKSDVPAPAPAAPSTRSTNVDKTESSRSLSRAPTVPSEAAASIPPPPVDPPTPPPEDTEEKPAAPLEFFASRDDVVSPTRSDSPLPQSGSLMYQGDVEVSTFANQPSPAPFLPTPVDVIGAADPAPPPPLAPTSPPASLPASPPPEDPEPQPTASATFTSVNLGAEPQDTESVPPPTLQPPVRTTVPVEKGRSDDEDEYHNVQYQDCVPRPLEEHLPETSVKIPLSKYINEDYFCVGASSGTRQDRRFKLRSSDPIPELELVFSGVTWACNLYGGKDFATSLPPDTVNIRLAAIGSDRRGRRDGLYRTTRLYQQLVTFHIEDLFAQFDLFNVLGTPGTGHIWRLHVGAWKLQVLDKLMSSARNKMLTSIHDIDDQSDIIMVTLEAVVPPALAGSKNAEDHMELDIDINVAPLRVNIDQDTLDFLSRFFGTTTAPPRTPTSPPPGASPSPPAPPATSSSSSSSPSPPPSLTPERGAHKPKSMLPADTTPENTSGSQSIHFVVKHNKPSTGALYFRRIRIGTLQIKLDYYPKRCDTNSLIKGDYSEVRNLVNVEAMVIDLKEVTVTGIMSDKVLAKLGEAWWQGLNVTELLNGVPTVRSVTRISSGAASLLKQPYLDCRQGRNPLSCLPHGIVNLARSMAVETLHLTEQMARLGGGITSIGVQALDEAKDDEVPMMAPIQPGNAFDGFRQAVEAVREGLYDGSRAISGIREQDEGGLLTTLARGLSLGVLRPVQGIFNGWTAMAQGTMTTLDPMRQAEHSLIYKKPKPEK
eukprot:Sspe_Gene.56955::Locus_31279_Transcript_1_1_Confidence_1.000_Length_7026::g.56955::m.56955/K17906/ATG2; autophagy-related protein 2